MPQTPNQLALKDRILALGRAAVCLALLQILAGCSSNPIIWSSGECRSSDGQMIAKAYTVEHGGFGTAGVETIVEIKRSVDGYLIKPQRVLAFSDSGRDIKLRVQWDGPRHLLATYAADPQTLYYQVLKTSGVDIAVRHEGNGVDKRL